jgi:hypothetical protein
MPAAKRSSRSSSRTSTFKEPAALKRLTKSLDSAQDALSELSKQGGRDVGQSAGAIYKDLRTFLSNARRHSGRLGKALARDFDQAQKALSKSAATSSGRRTATRSSSARSGSRATSSRSGSSRSSSSRTSSTSRARRSTTTAKRGTRTKK